ncbi:IclR family transcriptional regulator [Streptomyces sp. NBC_01351]|uniref:IclR family transcriptional regulator n=1 Tax=Streptomyces sp. NBC_01351 TaxID=2903833 RepID=UPI002E30E5B7|nr:IclR family transcriptional regulator [Streptomyces sp. NBC_01351]
MGATDTGSALEKTLRILEVVGAPGGPHRLAELAAGSGVAKSSAYRILSSLVEQGYAVTDGSGGYGIGLRLRSLSAQVATDRTEGIVELLEFLRRSTGQAVHLALLDGDALTCIRTMESGLPFRTGSRTGVRMAVRSTAIGRAVLAHLPPQRAEALVGAAERERLTAELDDVRARGYAVDDGGHEPAVRCLGTPVFDREGRPVGGLGLAGATSVTTREELERLAPALLEAARGVERLLQRG